MRLQWRWIVLGLLLIMAAGVRFHCISYNSYIHDEFWSLGSAMGHAGEQQELPRGRVIEKPVMYTRWGDAKPIAAVWDGQRRDVHPPVYFLMLRVWMMCFGTSETGARSLTVVVSVLNCGLLYVVAAKTTTRTAGLFACAMMALASPQIQVAQTARPYAVAVMFILLGFWALLVIEEKGVSRPRMLGLVGAVVGMLLTHYQAGMAGVAMAVYAGVRLRGGARWGVSGALVLGLGVFLGVWGEQLHYQIGQMGRYEHYWFNEPAEGHGWVVLGRVAMLPVSCLQAVMRNSLGFAWLSGAIYLLGVWLVVRNGRVLLWGLLLVAMVGPLAGVDWVKSHNHLGSLHYTYMATPAVFVLLGSAVLEHSRRWVRYAVPMAGVLGCVVGLSQAYVWGEEPDWRMPPAYLDRHIKEGEVVVFSAGTYGSYFTGFLYLATSHYSRSFPRPMVLLDEEAAPAETLAWLRGRPGVWVLKCSPLPATEELLPGFEVVESQFYPNIGFLEKIRVSKNTKTQG